MGDEERSTEAEQQGGEEEVKLVLHCPPIYPLPEGIKKMDRSETMCRYCGVSYLIFHEFHQLNSRVAQLEEELREQRGSTQREKAQREALELGRLEWERACHLEVQRHVEEKVKTTREELEQSHRDTGRAMREEFEQKTENMKGEYQNINKEKERIAVRDVESERKKREELERKSEEREKVLSDALQKANKNVEELRKSFQQLEERRAAAAASTKEEAEQLLGKEKQEKENLRGVCVRQRQALRSTLSALRASGSELTDVRGFLSQLTGAWQAFRSQILQHSTQAFSVLTGELKHSSGEMQKMREEEERLTQQLMEQRRQSEEQLSREKLSESLHRDKLLRLKEELEDKHEMWLSCQQRYDTMQEQLSSWQQREAQMSRKCRAAEEEVTRQRETLEKTQEETRELRRDREMLIKSHSTALSKMEEDCRQPGLAAALEDQKTQHALHLKEQMKEILRDAQLELTIEREKNQLLLLQHQRENTQLHQKLEEREQELQELQDELKEERKSREEEKLQEMQHSQQQEALQLSRAEAELQLLTERNAELQEEVALLQETVSRECEERGGLTAALSEAQEELLGLRSPASHQHSPRSHLTGRLSPPGCRQSQTRVAPNRSLNSPNTLRPPPAVTDKETGRGTDRGGAERSFPCLKSGGEKRREGTLPRLKPAAQ
ncbi:trichohyalin [Pseudochaenichthys georgianus]|uniref:trichohyalin n=1 Tax=Pseudochaenichthys georgianus TaxID=52239 RepID=UPI00146B9482|nr:leucine-, glutamate- and lysine-rich protein 1 isoform X2 [Pseudochaenichthys georgianus]